jgi:hypothetical protein
MRINREIGTTLCEGTPGSEVEPERVVKQDDPRRSKFSDDLIARPIELLYNLDRYILPWFIYRL